MQAWQGLSASHRQEKEYDPIQPIVTACRGQRLHRRDRGFWADGSHRWVQRLTLQTDECRRGNSSVLSTDKRRNMTQYERL